MRTTFIFVILNMQTVNNLAYKLLTTCENKVLTKAEVSWQLSSHPHDTYYHMPNRAAPNYKVQCLLRLREAS